MENVVPTVALSGAELFGAFCSAEDGGLSNREAYFSLYNVSLEAHELHELIERLPDDAMASDNPLRLLRTYQEYLGQAERQLQSIIDAASEYFSVANDVTTLLAKKQKIRVKALSV